MSTLRSLPARHPWRAWAVPTAGRVITVATDVFVLRAKESDAGDTLLKELAHLLKGSSRESDPGGRDRVVCAQPAQGAV